jgi:translation initiation factor IF-2
MGAATPKPVAGPAPEPAEPSASEPSAAESSAPTAEPGAGRPGALGSARLNALRRAFVQAPARAARTLAAVTPIGGSAAATPTAEVGGLGPAEPAAEEKGGRLRGLPRPAVAAAAVGVVLMGLPLVLGRGEGGADPVEPLGSTGMSRADAPVPEPEVSGMPAATTTGSSPATAAPTATPTGAPTDPGATGTPAPGTPAPGTPDQQPAAPAPVAQPAGSAVAARAGAGTTTRPAAGGAPQAPAQPQAPQPAAPAPAQPQAPQAQPQPQQPPAVVPPPAGPSYSAYAGPGCGSGGTGYSEKGRSSGSKDWVTRSDGGGGCGGQYTSVPMSGDRSKDDENSVVWTFTTSPVSSGSCRLSVYIPNNGDIKAVGGAPAYYTVQNDGGGTLGSFSINQPQNLGQWVSVGTYPVSGNRIAVVLHTRGIDWGSTAGAHLAASTVKADCTG